MRSLLLLDLDGTLIDTPHYEAWCSAAKLLSLRVPTSEEYTDLISGRPRQEGAESLLQLHCCGSNTRFSYSETLNNLVELKQAEFIRLAYKVVLYPDALRLLQRIGGSNQRVVFYTASRNAPKLFLRAAVKCGITVWGADSIVCQRQGEERKELFGSISNKYKPSEVLLVDDSAYAVEMARSLGMSAYQIIRFETEMSLERRAHTISSFDELSIGF